MTPIFPAVFLSHGSPMTALEQDSYTQAVHELGQSLPRPEAIVVVSAHWEASGPIRVTASEKPQVIYDFGGFPHELYTLAYPCPGSPALAAEIVALLEKTGLPATLDERRGLDHGAWIPLRMAYPSAEIPVVQVSLPRPRTPQLLLRMGMALGTLRERKVLLLGSGGVVHNLRLVRFGDKKAPVEGWARSFDDWVAARVQALDTMTLATYRDKAPHADRSVPTTEHFDPVFAVLGACRPEDQPFTVHEGFHYGNLSMRCFTLRASEPNVQQGFP